MSDKLGFTGDEIMFSSNDTPAEEFILAKKLGATINLDDFTHIDFLERQQEFPRKSVADIIRVEHSLFPQRSWTTPEMPSTV